MKAIKNNVLKLNFGDSYLVRDGKSCTFVNLSFVGLNLELETKCECFADGKFSF
jgi:hypothetical protein